MRGRHAMGTVRFPTTVLVLGILLLAIGGGTEPSQPANGDGDVKTKAAAKETTPNSAGKSIDLSDDDIENLVTRSYQCVANHTTFDLDNAEDQAVLAAYKPLGVEPGINRNGLSSALLKEQLLPAIPLH